MKALSRVVWSEGMHLAQHHFQAQARYIEDLAAFGFGALHFEPYGVVAQQLDDEALRNGTVSVIHARGIMPDGLVFQFPTEPTPEPLEIRELFSPTQDSHLVLLAIPAYRPDRANCADPQSANGARNGARFIAATTTVVDELTGRDEKPIPIARKNFRLLLDSEPTEGLVTLPIARVRRDGAGHFIYDPEYVPPCVQIGASERLLGILLRLVEVLDAKAAAIAAERAAGGTVAEYASREIASFWLSHAINSALAPLRHLLQVRTAHPEQLYLEMSRLAGALCTFSFTAHPRDLPAYDHQRLEHCFGVLDRHIREHLDVMLPSNCMTISLAPTGQQHFYAGRVTDRRAFDRARWFLGVRSSAPAGEIIGKVPKLVKLCSAKHIVRLVKEAFPGLALEHVPSPPPELSPRIGAQYFSIEPRGNPAAEACWKSIIETGEIGVYAPAAIPEAELEVLVVLE